MNEQDNNQNPIEGHSTVLSAPSRFLITAASFVVVVAGMRAAVQIIVPFLMSVFLAIISTPALFFLKKKGVSTVFAILIVSLIILLIGVLVATVLTTSIADFTQDLPDYATRLENTIRDYESRWNAWIEKHQPELLTKVEEELEGVSDKTDLESPPTPPVKPDETPEAKEPKFSLSSVVDAQAAINLIGDMLTQLGSVIANGFLIYLTTVFILLEASILPNKIKTSLKNRSETFEDLSTIADDVKRYLAIKTLISLATGVLVMVWLTFLHVKYPIVWGLIAFLLNFVPSIGSFIAAIPPTLLALVQPGLGIGAALWTAAGFLVINVVIGNIIEPRLMGQRFGLSTLVVFLSLIFWGWVLGPMGMLLSVPLTMTVKIVLQSHEDTRTMAILLGSQNPPVRKKKKTNDEEA